jgi:hypothetical protein
MLHISILLSTRRMEHFHWYRSPVFSNRHTVMRRIWLSPGQSLRASTCIGLVGTTHCRAAEVFSLFSPTLLLLRCCSLSVGDGDCSQLCRAQYALQQLSFWHDCFGSFCLSACIVRWELSHLHFWFCSISFIVSRYLQRWECQYMAVRIIPSTHLSLILDLCISSSCMVA